MQPKSYFGEDTIIQFTNKYYPKFDQLARILKVLVKSEDNKKLTNPRLGDLLGLPEMQVVRYTRMMVGFGLVQARQLLPTPFGNLVYQFDPYFERLETLWIVHYRVSYQPKYIVWHRLIQQVLPSLSGSLAK